MVPDLHEANGVRFLAENDMIVNHWCRAGKPFEPRTTGWIWSVMADRAGFFVDVGASTGWFSVALAKMGIPVIAVEPNPAPRARLLENCALNGVEIEVHGVAASRRAGRTVLWRNPRVPLTSGGSIERATCSSPEAIEVETRTLDSIVADRRAALIKIDVEGHEMAVLAGAEDVITRDRPHLMLEANTEGHRAALAGWLEAAGYDWRRADDRNLLCSPRF